MDASLLEAAAVVPAAPYLLPEASPGQPDGVREALAALREDVRAAIAGLPPADVVLVVGPGPRRLHGGAVASLVPLGIPGVGAELPVERRLAEHVARLTGYPLVDGSVSSVEHTVLLLLLREVRGEVPVLPVTVPASDPAAFADLGASLVVGLAETGQTGVLVACGDLASTLDVASPGYLVEGARAWDEAVVAALAADDLRGVCDLGPAAAERVGARGWAPLVVLHGAGEAAGLSVTRVGYSAPRGVGHLVAECRPRATAATAEGSERGAAPAPGG